MITANIFDVKRFSINDGDGIRTTLFIKGCPLRCAWCQNPEGIETHIRVWYAKNACAGCRACEAACPVGAIGWDERGAKIDHAKCTLCERCAAACPTGAMRLDARETTVEQALAEIEKDVDFYGKDGGVTLSGGECMQSPAFSLAVLRACRERGIGTSIETCLLASPALVDEFAETCDLIFADVKLIDPARHRAATGADNALILENIRRLNKRGANLVLRVPLIPGFTADRANIEAIADFAASLDGDVPVELLNFNPMCRDKYESMRLNYPLARDERELPQEDVDSLKAILTSRGVRAL